MNGDFIRHPVTGKWIEKYESRWWFLIRQGYDEDELELMETLTYPAHLTLVKNLPPIKPIRTGAILYTVNDGKLLFGLGVDAIYKQLTDFSGGNKKGESPIYSALREFCEETLHLYCLKEEEIQESVAMVDKHHLVLFIYTHLDPGIVTLLFRMKGQGEMIDIVWIDEDDLMNEIIHPSFMYLRLANFLAKANFIKYLKFAIHT